MVGVWAEGTSAAAVHLQPPRRGRGGAVGGGGGVGQGDPPGRQRPRLVAAGRVRTRPGAVQPQLLRAERHLRPDARTG